MRLDREPFDRLVLNGDTIHHLNFRKMTRPHSALLERLRRIGKERELVLVRGNHDHQADYVPGTSRDQLTTASVLPSLLGVPMAKSISCKSTHVPGDAR